MTIYVLSEDHYEFGECTSYNKYWTSSKDVADAWLSKPDLEDGNVVIVHISEKVSELK